MEKLSISSISQNIFRTSPNKNKVESNQTNPFGVSFKGNVLTADVFENKNKADKINFTGNMENIINKAKNRFKDAAFVGSINKMKTFMNLDSIMSPINRAGEKIANVYNKLNSITVTDALISARKAIVSAIPTNNYSVKSLQKQEISSLRNLFNEHLALEAV